MVLTDPIGDMLTRIRNANTVYRESVDMPSSKIKVAVAEILKREGYIKDYAVLEEEAKGSKRQVLRIFLKYGPGKERVIRGIKRVSKPGRRIYVDKRSLPKVIGGYGLAVISTSAGLMTDEEARRRGLGGEVLCYVW